MEEIEKNKENISTLNLNLEQYTNLINIAVNNVDTVQKEIRYSEY